MNTQLRGEAATTPDFAIALPELLTEISYAYAQDEEVPALTGVVHIWETFPIVRRRVLPQHINAARGEIKRMLGDHLPALLHRPDHDWSSSAYTVRETTCGVTASDEENTC